MHHGQRLNGNKRHYAEASQALDKRPCRSAWLALFSCSSATCVKSRISLMCFSLQLLHLVERQCSQIVNASILLQHGHWALTGRTSIRLIKSRLFGSSAGPWTSLITFRHVGLGESKKTTVETRKQTTRKSNQSNVFRCTLNVPMAEMHWAVYWVVR